MQVDDVRRADACGLMKSITYYIRIDNHSQTQMRSMDIEESRTGSMKYIEPVHQLDQYRHTSTARSMSVVGLMH